MDYNRQIAKLTDSSFLENKKRSAFFSVLNLLLSNNLPTHTIARNNKKLSEKQALPSPKNRGICCKSEANHLFASVSVSNEHTAPICMSVQR
jgi:hypothetical protein